MNSTQTTKYHVTTDGSDYPSLTGAGIEEVDAIDATTAIVTVRGNGAMFEQHANTCPAIISYRELKEDTAPVVQTGAATAYGITLRAVDTCEHATYFDNNNFVCNPLPDFFDNVVAEVR